MPPPRADRARPTRRRPPPPRSPATCCRTWRRARRPAIDVVLDEATGAPRLVFDSTIGNVGEGPLILTARRKAGERRMTAHQVIRRSDGSSRVRRRSPACSSSCRRPTTSTGTCSASTATSCGPATRADGCGATASKASASATAMSCRPTDRSRISRAGPATRVLRQGPARADASGRGHHGRLGRQLPGQHRGPVHRHHGIAPGRYLLVHRIRRGGLLEAIPTTTSPASRSR